MEKVLLKPEEAARVLNVSRATVYELLRTHKLRSVKIGRSRRIPTEAIENYVAGLSEEAV
jgi:excisionase family DNA binding protein